MNELKFIRNQCNFSLGGLAEYIGVSRQIISACLDNETYLVKKQGANCEAESEGCCKQISTTGRKHI